MPFKPFEKGNRLACGHRGAKWRQYIRKLGKKRRPDIARLIDRTLWDENTGDIRRQLSEMKQSQGPINMKGMICAVVAHITKKGDVGALNSLLELAYGKMKIEIKHSGSVSASGAWRNIDMTYEEWKRERANGSLLSPDPEAD